MSKKSGNICCVACFTRILEICFCADNDVNKIEIFKVNSDCLMSSIPDAPKHTRNYNNVQIQDTTNGNVFSVSNNDSMC